MSVRFRAPRFTLDQWCELLLRSVGFEPGRLTVREQDIVLVQMVPFVMRKPQRRRTRARGTGKSHLFQQVSPYAHLVFGGVEVTSGLPSRPR